MTRIALVAALAAVLACGGTRIEDGSAGGASDAVDVTDSQLHTTMRQLADGIRGLQAVFSDETVLGDEQQTEVLRILDQMIAASEGLGPHPVSTGHPQVAHNLDRFREKLEIARESAAMLPPRYYLSGNLVGTCLACHGDI